MSWEVNDELVKELRAWFLDRNDRVVRWGGLIGSYLALPGLRGFYSMATVGDSGQAIDAVRAFAATNNNNATFGYDKLAPYCEYNGTTQYHNISDATSGNAYDILGTEAHVAAAYNGLTIGMWLQFKALPSAVRRVFSKGTTTGNARAYALATTAANLLTFIVSTDGTNTVQVSDTVVFAVDTWYFLAARYTPSSEIKIYVGTTGVWRTNTNTTSIPASIFNSGTGLGIGAQADGTQFSNIRASMCFVSVEKLDDATIFGLFEQSRKVFGV